MPLSSPDFLCGDPFRRETSRPLLRRLAPFPLALGCSRPLVSVDTESSDVVQEIPHRYFPDPQRSPRPSPVFRTPRTSAVSCPPCAPQIPSGIRCDCSIANRWYQVNLVPGITSLLPSATIISTVVVVVVVFTLKTVLTSIQYPSLSYSSRQRNEFPWSHANPK